VKWIGGRCGDLVELFLAQDFAAYGHNTYQNPVIEVSNLALITSALLSNIASTSSGNPHRSASLPMEWNGGLGGLPSKIEMLSFQHSQEDS